MSQHVCPQGLQGSLIQTSSTYFTGFPNAMLSSYKKKKRENRLRRMKPVQYSGHGSCWRSHSWLAE